MEIKTVFIILNYKTFQDTEILVDSLLKQDLGNRRIIIVDNASKNGSYEILSAKYKDNKEIDVLYSEVNGGYSKGNNVGLNYAKKYKPKYVCVVNNDVRFDLSLIQELEKLYSIIPNVGILAPRQIKPNGEDETFFQLKAPTFWTDFTSYIPGYIKFFGKSHIYIQNTSIDGLQKVGFIPGAFIFISYDLFYKCGFFEELTFLFCEERVLCKKIHDLGLNSYIYFNKCYIHDHSKTINSEVQKKRQKELIFKGRLIYTKKYRKYPLVKIFLLKIVYLVNSVFDFIRFTKF